MPTERRRTSRGADPDAVLGHSLQAGDPRLDQSREAIDQQAFEHRTMSDPEVPEGLGVHADTLRDPLIFIYGCLRQTVSTTLDSKCHPMSCHSHRIAIPLMQSQGD